MGVVVLRSSLGISVVLHAMILFGWAFVFTQQSAKNAPRPLTWIEVDPIKLDAYKKSRSRQTDDPSKRVVQTQHGKKVEDAAPDSFLGMQNQVFERQSVSKSRKSTIGGSKPKVAENRVQESQKSKQGVRSLKSLGLAIVPQGEDAFKQKPPGQDLSRWVTQGEGLAQDYVEGLKEGDLTALNTKEYVFYGYFQRIRQRLDLAWTRSLRDNLTKFYRGGRRLASEKDHRTKTLVTLNAQGEITRVELIEESGTHDLDDAAVRAFNQAGPFPNPPKGIADRNGNITISWEFVLRS